MDLSSFDLAQPEFWSAPRRTARATSLYFTDAAMSGVRIAAPSFIALDVHQTLPLLVFRGGPFREVWAVDYSACALVTTIDLDRGRMLCSSVDPKAGERPPREPVDLSQAPEGYDAALYVLDLRERLGVEWTPGRFLVTIVMRDQVSNRARVALGKSESVHRDEEVDKFLADEWDKPVPPAIQPPPGKPYPFYQETPDSPAIPAGTGIAINVERILPLRPGSQWILRGSFRLPVHRRELVKPGAVVAGAAAGQTPTAIVGITLLVTGGEQANPSLIDLRVPAYDKLDAAAPEATGHFTLNLLDMPGLSKLPQTYFIYAFAGEVMAGPFTSALVPEALLPKKP